jgi:hypothetical protein
MSDTPPTSPTSPPGGGFCAECGAAMPADARFCGSCGAPPPGADAGPPAGGADPTVVSGASSWQGVEPVLERPTEVVPPVPPGPAGPPPVGPPPGAPPVGGPPAAPSEGKGKGALVAAIIVVLALLGGGAFFLLGGDDDGDEDVAAQEDEDEDEETTTTEEEDEETTTTEAADDTTTTEPDVDDTTTTPEVVDPGLTFAQAQDDTGRLVVEVPDFWQVNGAPLGDGTPNIIAAEDIQAFVSGFQSSGLSYTLLNGTADPDATIDFLATTNNLFAACEEEPREDYTDGVFTGRRQVFANCEGSGITIVDIVGTTAAGVSIDITMALAPDDPFDIITRIEQTFNLTS